MSTMVERPEIPEHIWEDARSLRSAVLWESNSSVEHIALALLAAEKRGKEEAAKYHDDLAAQHKAEINQDGWGNHWHASQYRAHLAHAAAIRGS